MIISGGHAIKYWSSLTLDFRKRSIGPSDIISKEEGIKVGVTVKKNHCTPSAKNPYKKLEYFAVFGEGIEQILTALEQAFEVGIAEMRGSWIQWYDSNGEVINKFQGKAAFREHMKNNVEDWKRFSSMLDDSFGVQDLSIEEIEEIQNENMEINKNVKLDYKTKQELKEKEKETKKKTKAKK